YVAPSLEVERRSDREGQQDRADVQILEVRFERYADGCDSEEDAPRAQPLRREPGPNDARDARQRPAGLRERHARRGDQRERHERKRAERWPREPERGADVFKQRASMQQALRLAELGDEVGPFVHTNRDDYGCPEAAEQQERALLAHAQRAHTLSPRRPSRR